MIILPKWTGKLYSTVINSLCSCTNVRTSPYHCSKPRPQVEPPKPFHGTRSEYKTFIMPLNLIFHSGPDQYTSANADNAKIAYVAVTNGFTVGLDYV